MKTRPILFSGPLVRAILDGRKTVTRRPVTDRYLQPSDRYIDGLNEVIREALVKGCPFGAAGDRLWVRETWAPCPYRNHPERRPVPYPMELPDVYYRATDWRATWADAPWRPSIHMPRWASRITLEVTSVRVERLQAVTEDEAVAEGFEPAPVHGSWAGPRETGEHWSARKPFAETWDSIYGKRPGLSWAASPWVWAVSFKVVEVKR